MLDFLWNYKDSGKQITESWRTVWESWAKNTWSLEELTEQFDGKLSKETTELRSELQSLVSWLTAKIGDGAILLWGWSHLARLHLSTPGSTLGKSLELHRIFGKNSTRGLAFRQDGTGDVMFVGWFQGIIPWEEENTCWRDLQGWLRFASYAPPFNFYSREHNWVVS